ncbi:MAG: hypothetical protein IT367_20330 [Candidatus Hydrogenedentes bacterium]|nr:hypothetical protein [Candidatus Hydrogenedentota bacterium]
MNEMMAIMSLLTGGGNLMGQIGNLGAQGMSAASAIWDALRFFQRNSDPTINDIREYDVNRFNKTPYGPFGDVEGSFGGMFGTREDGSPVQFGDMAARQTNYMLENNVALPALDILKKAGEMQRPGMASFGDFASGDASRMSPPALVGGQSGPSGPNAGLRPASPQSYVPGPSAVKSPVLTSTRVEGVGAPAGPDPRISAPTPGPGSAVRQVVSDVRGGAAPAIAGLFNRQAPGQPVAKPLGARWLENQGGVPGLVSAAREPGNMFNALADRRRAQLAGLFA